MRGPSLTPLYFQQAANLYIEETTSPVTDVENPDLDTYPKFAAAMKYCIQLVLKPGDMLFIPGEKVGERGEGLILTPFPRSLLHSHVAAQCALADGLRLDQHFLATPQRRPLPEEGSLRQQGRVLDECWGRLLPFQP